MLTNLTDRAQQALALAQKESQHYRHGFVGTEHILLALVSIPAGEVTGLLAMAGADPPRVRHAVEALISSGSATVSAAPFTPRARQAIEIAAEEARHANQKQVDTTHLLLGLMRETQGFAAKALTTLGLDLMVIREEVFKIRHIQMKLVERAVRPVPASLTQKRKMREELLAHLSAIYEEELGRLGNPVAAMQAAADRFGDPTDLAGELASALPISERINYYVTRLSARRPHESDFRYMLRFASGMTVFVIVFLLCFLLPAAAFLKDGWGAMLILTRPLVLVLPFLFLDSFLFGLLYFRLRDAMVGAPWARKSLRKAALYEAMIALVAFVSALAFTMLVNTNPAHPASFRYVSLAAVALAAIGFPLVAGVNGQGEISDAVWAALDDRKSEPELAP